MKVILLWAWLCMVVMVASLYDNLSLMLESDDSTAAVSVGVGS